MRTRTTTLFIQSAAALAAALLLAPAGLARQAAPAWAITGARVHTAAGAPIDNATVLVRDGVIAAVGTSVTVPADAVVIDAAGQNVYPGLIDMGSSAPIEAPEGQQAQAGGGRGGGGGFGGRGGGGGAQQTKEEAERAKREALLRPDYSAEEHLQGTSAMQEQLASAGVTAVLAVSDSGIFKGTSALVNTLLPPDDPQISDVAGYRKGLAVIKAPVAQHVNIAGRAGGTGYPQSLLGSIAFARQGFYDAQWQRDAEAYYQRTGAKGPRPLIEPALDALAPALARQLPVAFDADLAREIDRVLTIASTFNLDPIVVGASGAAERTAELKAAGAKVILSLNYPGGGGGRGGGGGGFGGRGGGGQPTLAALEAQRDAPKTAAAVAAAGIPFAFTSDGMQTAADFVRNAGRAVRDGGLAADVALRALTIDAARLAGAADRVGSIETGKIANLIVVEGDLFDNGRIRQVFIAGRPVEIQPAAAPATGRGGRGGDR
ncbi:MAG: amidohydrolase family protein [Vicinamibacterales bacterium]